MASRRVGLIALAAVVLAPLAIQKLQATLGPMINGVALMTMNKTPIGISEFEFKTEDGVSRSLANYRGQFLLVNVWATWCPPCRKEMPSLDRFKKALAAVPDIDVIAISVDRASIAQVRAFYSFYEIRYLPLLLGVEDEVMSALRVRGLPTTLLLNRDGLEIGRLVGPTEWCSPPVIEKVTTLSNGQVMVPIAN